MFKKPTFWIVLTLVSIGSAVFTIKYFPHAFPLVTLDLQMNRQGALQSARDLSQQVNWGPEGFSQAASFRLNQRVQNFVELEAGGTEAFRKMLEEGLYSPYTWRVRHFKEGETNETLVRFTPQGNPYGFIEKLPEDEPGASLTPESALTIAEKRAINDWGIDLSSYELVEESEETHLGGRTDHTFVYERSNATIGEGRYRLRLVVGGDDLIELTHFIKIPEAFFRRHQEMRSANNTIASIAVIAVGLFYILGGCIIGLFFLLRQRWVIWRIPLLWGLLIAFLQVLAGINQWPLAWMNYDTALSANGFFLSQIGFLLINFLFLTVITTLAFMAAESLSRKAFPHHIQQWRLWSTGVANSPSVIGRTIGGYLLVSIFWAYEVALFFFSTNVLGWWAPSEALFQPDMLATYFPWLSSIAISAQAGFWEESLFRAVPIAGAALLGKKFGHRNAWIAGAFILQALVFSAAHANYPTQPAYARLVELIIPSIGFGLIYLYFGLLPAIVLHFTVDVVAFAMPLFVSSAPGTWMNQILVILLTGVPVWILVRARLSSGRWNEISETDYNRNWSPSVKEARKVEVTELPEREALSPTIARFLPLAGLIGLVLWLLFANFQTDVPSLTIKRNESKELAKKFLSETGAEVSDEFEVLARIGGSIDQQDRFIWRTGGEEIYQELMGEYLLPPHWRVRFARFEGDVTERAEEYQVFIGGKEDVFRIRHQLPESREGASISEEDARILAHKTIKDKVLLEPALLKEVSAKESKLPNRRDWVFTFADTVNYLLPEGEARIAIQITGDQIGDSRKYIHVPEEWARQERNQRNLTSVLSLFCNVILILVVIAGIVGAVINWSKSKDLSEKNFSPPVFISFFVFLFGLGVFNLINSWPATYAYFSTAEPVLNQTFSTIAFSLLGSLFLSMGLALIIAFLQVWKGTQPDLHGLRPLLWGFSLGLLMTGLLAVMTKITPSLEPVWAEYISAGTYIPVFASGLHPLSRYIATTTLVLIIFIAMDRFTQGWSRRKGLFFFILIIIGVTFAGYGSIDSIVYWLELGLVLGMILLFAYQIVLRFHLSLVPLMVAVMFILNELRQGIYQAHPAALPGSILAIVLLGSLSIYWFKKLQRN